MCFRCSGDNSGVIPRGSGGGSSSGTEQNVSSKGESWGGKRGSACNGGPGPMANPGGFSAWGAADGTSRGSWALRSTKGLVCKDLVWNRGLGEGEHCAGHRTSGNSVDSFCFGMLLSGSLWSSPASTSTNATQAAPSSHSLCVRTGTCVCIMSL